MKLKLWKIRSSHVASSRKHFFLFYYYSGDDDDDDTTEGKKNVGRKGEKRN